MALRASVVIPLYQRVDLTRACLAALEHAGLEGVEIVLVDNASTDGTHLLLDEMEGSATVIRNPANLGFAAACNQGARAARAPVVVFLNSDTEVQEGWLEPLLAAVEDPAVGVAGSRLLYPSGRVQHAGMALAPGCLPLHVHRGVPGAHPVAAQTRNMMLLTGACMAIDRGSYLRLGGFDEGYRNGFEDTDLCMRIARAGLVARYCGDSVVTHHESMSPGRSDYDDQNMARFRRTWLRWPPDWDRVLGNDGLVGIGPADALWEGPLFDGGRQAAAGRDAIVSLADAGFRPVAREIVVGDARPDAPCPDEVLAALNRWNPSAPGYPVLRHLATGVGTVPPRPAGAGAVVVVADPGFSTVAAADDVDAVVALEGLGDVVTALASVSGGGARPPRQGIGWWGPLLGRSGYASAGRGLLAAASLVDRPVRLLPADRAPEGGEEPVLPQLGPQEFDPWIWVLHHIPVSPDGVNFWEHLMMAAGRDCVGATCFETETLPSSWIEPCNAMREIWVPSRFNARTFASAGVRDELIHVVPYPVDCDLFSPGPARDCGGEGFTFLSVFEWTWRKGWDALIEAYVREFRPDEPVRLRLLTYRGAGARGNDDIHGSASRHIEACGFDSAEVADIELVLEPVGLAGLADLYRSADAFVLATRGEGAGMPVLEAMACGTPVVATAYGGHEHLMEPDLAYPVRVERMIEAPPAMVRDNPLYSGQRLAEPSVGHLRAQMRAVYEDRAEAARRAERARRVVSGTLSISAVAAVLEHRIDELTGSSVADRHSRRVWAAA